MDYLPASIYAGGWDLCRPPIGHCDVEGAESADFSWRDSVRPGGPTFVPNHLTGLRRFVVPRQRERRVGIDPRFLLRR